MLTAIETTATINANHQIVLDEELPSNAPNRVRVIVLFDEDTTNFGERGWLQALQKMIFLIF